MELENLDLNIKNYELNDILNLFKLDSTYDVEDLKNAKKIVLKCHPDKSGLDKKYFLFFTSAYKVLYQIHEFKNKTTNRTTSYYNNDKNDNKDIIDKIKKREDFNEWFNKEFEKMQIRDETIENGYGEWLSSNDDIDNRITTKNNMNKDIENKKKELRSVVKHRDIQTIDNINSYDQLGGAIPETYSCDIFGKLKYDDLKKAHIESVIPVTHDDYIDKEKFTDVESLNSFRNTQNTTPLSLNQAKEYLNSRDNDDASYTTTRAYNLAKQSEEIERKSNEWWSKIKQIK